MKITRFRHDNSEALVNASGAGAAVGGDLGGTVPAPTVVGIQTVPVATTAPTNGQVLVYDAGAGHYAPLAITGTPTGAAGGDLGGSYPNPDVEAVDGVVFTGVPAVGNVPVATSATTAVWGPPAEILMADGVTSPPIPIETEDGSDWMYSE